MGYLVSEGLLYEFMAEILNELDISHHTKSSCQIEVDFNGNNVDFTKIIECNKIKILI